MNTTIAQQIANEGGVEAYLHAQQHKSLLRFLTCGSVDDGKSTLIGRLLHDTRQIYEDQLSSLHNDSKRHGTQGEKLDLALLVDGLQAEREQGITIDVAYRYFSTEKRKFIIADTPGHEQYTRNMATGASTCDLAILLIDARKGVLDQTRRHSFISTLLGIKHLVVAVNKMDLVEFSEARFNEIREDYLTFAEQLYLAAERPVLERDGMLMMIDDDRIDLQPGEVIEKRMVRFRTLGCWPLTGAVESEAQTLPEIIEEMLVSTTSERQGRVIDRDQAGSMELKKRQGYF